MDYFNKLVEFDKKYGAETYAQCFYIVEDEDDFFEHWCDLDEKKRQTFSKMMKIFASSDGTGGRYAFWLKDKEMDYNSAPIVCFGSEGEMFVVAENIRDLLKMLSFGPEMFDGNFYHSLDEENYYAEFITYQENFEIFREWMREELGIEPVDIECLKENRCNESKEVIKLHEKALKRYKKEFDDLIYEYFPYIKEYEDKLLKEYESKKRELLESLEKKATVALYIELAKNEMSLENIDFEARDNYYYKALELEPENIEVLTLLAESYRFKDPKKALTFYLKLIKLVKKPKKFYDDIARVYDLIKESDLSIKYYIEAISSGYTGYQGSNQEKVIELCRKKKKMKDCIKMLESTLEKNPDFHTYRVLYRYFLSKKEYKKALEYALNYIEKSNQQAHNFIGVGGNFLSKNLYQEALKVYQKILDEKYCHKSDKVKIYNLIGICYIRMDSAQIDKAFSAFKNVFELDNDEEAILTNIPLCASKYLDQEEYEKAIDVYIFCIEKMGMRDGAIYNNLGVSYVNLEKYDEAMRWYEKALQTDPDRKLYIENMQELKKIIKQK